MSSYYQQQRTAHRGHNTELKKGACTSVVEYFRQDGELHDAVSLYDDGFVFASKVARLPVPALAVPSTASAYAGALGQLLGWQQAQHNRLWNEALAARDADDPARLLRDYTALDFEFIPAGKHLLEVAAVRWVNGEPRPPFQSFVCFRGPVPSQITQLTGITAGHVVGAPAEKRVLGLLRTYVGDSLLVCHNIGADRGVYLAARERCGATEPLANRWLCTLALAKKRLPKGTKCGLKELCHTLELPLGQHHRALDDARMCAQLLQYFHRQQPVGFDALFREPVAKGATPTLFAQAA